jgi:hypothetical protein
MQNKFYWFKYSNKDVNILAAFCNAQGILGPSALIYNDAMGYIFHVSMNVNLAVLANLTLMDFVTPINGW